MRRTLCLVAVAVVTMASGCVKIEQHVTVRENAKADAGFALRLPAQMGMAVGQMLGQQMGGATAELPPGLEFGQREENGEAVIEVRVAAELLPPPMTSLYKVTTEERLLTRTYRLSINPKALDPREFVRMGEGLQTRGPADPTVMLTQLNLPGLGGLDFQTPEGLQKALGMLGDLLGGEMQLPPGLNAEAMLSQIEMATYAHMPGRLAETSGEKVDDTTAKWLMTPKQPEEIMALAGEPLTAVSEAANGPRIDDLARRLAEGRGLKVSVDDLVGLVARRLIPNPQVAPEETPVVDADLYSQLVTLAAGLDGTVGPNRTLDVMEALGVRSDQPSLSAATRAAKRLPRLREQPNPTELPLEAVIEALTQ